MGMGMVILKLSPDLNTVLVNLMGILNQRGIDGYRTIYMVLYHIITRGIERKRGKENAET